MAANDKSPRTGLTPNSSSMKPRMKILTGIAIGIIVCLSFPAEAQKMAPWQEKQIADPKFDRVKIRARIGRNRCRS